MALHLPCEPIDQSYNFLDVHTPNSRFSLDENLSISNRLSSSSLDGIEGRRSSDGKKEKKGKSERSENTSVVIGMVDTIEKFQELLERIGQTCGPVRSHYYRAYQQCGFIYFHDEETATKTKQNFDGTEFHGQFLKACAPLTYFDNELDARPIPPDSARRASKDLVINVASSLTDEAQLLRASDVASAGEPSCTLVLKNLSFNLKQEKLLELLSQMGIPPQSVNYHYDQNGNFCGIAFAKYKRVEEAVKALIKLRVSRSASARCALSTSDAKVCRFQSQYQFDNLDNSQLAMFQPEPFPVSTFWIPQRWTQSKSKSWTISCALLQPRIFQNSDSPPH